MCSSDLAAKVTPEVAEKKEEKKVVKEAPPPLPEPEMIKTQRITLTGPVVVSKIELPVEPEKKEKPAEENPADKEITDHSKEDQ